MTDELLPYYNRELAFVRELGAEFAAANPKIAGRLRWAGQTSEDPHVSRMIEAFAFLNARTRHKLDDEFPEVSQSMLGVLYPHFLSPIPSTAIVECRLDEAQATLVSGYSVPRGATLETGLIQDQPCRFRTCYDTRIWPIKVLASRYQGKPFQAPETAASRGAASVLRIRLGTLSPKIKFSQLAMDQLRFYLHGQGEHVYHLYELLHNHCLGISFACTDSKSKVSATDLVRDAVRPVGFDKDQGLIDYSPRSFIGYRLLSEYFTLPEKFLFADIDGFEQARHEVGDESQLDVYIYLDRHLPELEGRIDESTLRIGCTPIVNLFRQRAEPIRLTQTQFEHRVVPDARRPAAHEVYSIDQVVGTLGSEEFEFHPFYATKHGNEKSTRFWHSRRESAGYAAGQVDQGTEVYLSFVDLNLDPTVDKNLTIDVHTTCLNRDLPGRLPFGGGQPELRFNGEASIARVTCLTAPKPTFRPAMQKDTLWKLVSHLNLNYLALTDGDQGAEALREILKLYDPAQSQETTAIVESLQSVKSRRVVGRVAGATASGFCRGVEVTLDLDEDRFSGSSAYLFASVLERFLTLYTSINSFTKTVVTTNRRTQPMRTWPPRAGEQLLL